jgi:hypothetical protein
MGAVAKSPMRKGLLIYEEMRKYLVLYEEAVSHILLCNRSLLDFLILYMRKILFYFLSLYGVSNQLPDVARERGMCAGVERICLGVQGYSVNSKV